MAFVYSHLGQNDCEAVEPRQVALQLGLGCSQDEGSSQDEGYIQG